MFIDIKQTAATAQAGAQAGAQAEPVPAARADASVLDVGYLVGVVWNRRRSVFLGVVACMLAALLFGLFAPARYTATVQILVDPNDLRVVDNVLRGQNQLTETHITQVENQVRVLLSNNVAKRVVERLKLDRDPDFIGSGASWLDPRVALRALFGASSATQPDPALEALTALKKRISSRRVDRTYVVDASVWAHSPQQAVKIANALLEAFLEEQSAARAEAARRASTSLDARLTELRERVRQAEQRVEDYKKANNLISSGGTPVNERQVTELSSQLVLARARSAEAKARYDKIMEAQKNRADPGAIGEAVGSATITALRTQLAEIARKEGEINATLGSRHPAVIEIASQARRIRTMIEEEVARIAEAARNDMERAQANEASLAASLERLKTELEGTNNASVKLRELERDVGASRSVYEAFLVRTREVSEQERLDTTNVRVIAAPDLPESRSFPPRTLILLAAGGVLGGMLGVALAFLGEWRERRAPALAVATPAPVVAPAAPYVPAPPLAAAPVAPPPVVTPPYQTSTIALAVERARQPDEPAPPYAATPTPRRKQTFRL